MTVRDSHGNILGTVHSNSNGDRIIRDAQGNQTGTITQSGYVYDQYGNLVGKVS